MKTPDKLVMISKGILGALPIVGPMTAEIVGNIIPNQRIDRIEKLLHKLENKIEGVDKSELEQKLQSSEHIDIVEDCFILASRALSNERLENIASLLKNGLVDMNMDHVMYKRFIYLLNQINDIEIIILKSYTFSQGSPDVEEFWNKHEDIINGPEISTLSSNEEDIDQSTIYKTHRKNLVNLGLLKIRFKKPRRGELPEFDDKTGMVKAQGYEINSLGRLLLKAIEP